MREHCTRRRRTAPPLEGLTSRSLTGKIPYFSNGRRCVSSLPNPRWLRPLFLCCTGLEFHRPWRCVIQEQAQVMRQWRSLQVRERKALPGKCIWKHHSFIPGFILVTLHRTFCSVQRPALFIHIDTRLLIFFGLHNIYLIFISLPPVWLIFLTLKPLALSIPKCWLPQQRGLENAQICHTAVLVFQSLLLTDHHRDCWLCAGIWRKDIPIA